MIDLFENDKLNPDAKWVLGVHVCTQCGANYNFTDGYWRNEGTEGYTHKCPSLIPQAGYFPSETLLPKIYEIRWKGAELRRVVDAEPVEFPKNVIEYLRTCIDEQEIKEALELNEQHGLLFVHPTDPDIMAEVRR